MSWEKDDGWNKKSASRRPRGRSHHAPATPSEPESGSTWAKSKRKADKRQKRRTLTWLVGAVFLLLLIAVAALPTVAGVFAPGIIASKASEAITGRVEVDSVSLGWFGGQRVTGLRLYDTDDQRRSDLEIRSSKGLLAIAFAGGDFGTVTVSGSIDASPNKQGEPFTTNTVGPSQPAPSSTVSATKPPALPKNLKATLVLDNLQVQYAAQSEGSPVEAIRLDEISGTVAVDTTNDSIVDIEARLTRKAAGDAVFERAGHLAIDATASGLTDADGTLTPDAVSFTATVTARGVETRLAEAFTDQQGRLSDALGETLDLAATAGGSPTVFDATIDFSADAMTAHAPLRIDLGTGTVASTEPVTATLDTGRLSMLLPDRDALVGPGAGVHVTAYPSVNLSIASLRVPIPGESGLDLRNAGVQLVATLGRLAATVNDPTGARAVGFEPATITLNAADLSAPVSITTAIGTTIDGAPSGTLAVNLTADGLLNDSGAFNTADLPTIDGTVRAKRLALAAFQPIAQAAGFDLVETLGDTADLTIEATPNGSGATRITIAGASPHAGIDGELLLDGAAIGNTGTPITVRLDRPAPALAGFLKNAGVDITGASGLMLTVADLALNLEQIGNGNLANASGSVSAALDRIDATHAETGRAVSAVSMGARVETGALAGGVELSAAAGFTLDDAPAGKLQAGFTAADLLDAAGGLNTVLPSDIRGTLSLIEVRSAALAAFVPTAGLDLSRTVGPTLDAAVTAIPTGTPGVTAVALSINSQHLKGLGNLKITPDRLIGSGDALTLDHTAVGPVLQAFLNAPRAEGAPKSPLRFTTTTPGRATLTVRDLDIPLNPRSIETSGKASIAANLLDLVIAGDGNALAGTVQRLGATLTLAPGSPPTLAFNGQIFPPPDTVPRIPGVMAGSFRLANAFTPIDDQGRVTIAPNGELTANSLPTSLARMLAISFPAGEGTQPTPLHAAIANIAGPTADFRLTTSRETDPAKAPDAPILARVSVTAGQHTAGASFALRPSSLPNAAGAFTVVDATADASLAIDTNSFRGLMSIAAPAAPPGMTVASQGTLTLSARTQNETISAIATLSPTTLTGLTATAASQAQGGARRPLPPMTLTGTATADAPAALLTDPTGTHAVALKADFTGTDNAGTPVLVLATNASTSLTNSAPAGTATASLRVTSKETAWLDALAGMDGLLFAALGETLELRSDMTAEFAQTGSGDAPAMKTASATASVNAPNLRMAQPASIAIENGTLRLSSPATVVWTITPAALQKIAPTTPGKAAQLTLASPANFTLRANRFGMPIGEGGGRLAVDMDASAPGLPLRFSDGSAYTLTDLKLKLTSMAEAGTGKLIASAATESAPDKKAIAIDGTVTGLPTQGRAFDAAALSIHGVAKINDLPMRLIDALAAGDGQLVDLLGPALNAEATLANLPMNGGTLSFIATTDQASSRLNATVRPHPAHAGSLALIADGAMRTEITHFDYEFAGKKIAVIPVFGSVKKIENTHRPATVTLSQLVAPTDGDIARIVVQGTVDPGVIEYEFEQGLATLLEITKQRTQSNAGERLQPFTISMRDGVARFDNLAVPLGEFIMTGKGSFDLIRNYEDITIGIPAGAFAGEIIGGLPGGASGLLKESIIVPVRRRGPMGAENKWEPDFESVLKDLFTPENILDNVIKGGLKDLFGGG